jgi:hypothetical protein
MAGVHPTIRFVTASWARIEPVRGAYDEGELDRLQHRVRQVRAEGSEPVVVLHAGSLPDWVIARHGWLDPDIGADWGCYVDRVAQRLAAHVHWWAPIRGPLEEAGWYDDHARLALRALLDAHAAAFLHLKRTQGFGGRPPDVGTMASWATWVGDGLRGRAEAQLRRRLGPDAWVSVLATGRLAPPFSLVGELPNGTPALDWIGVEWEGEVSLPAGEVRGADPDGLVACIGRLAAHGKPLLVPGAGAPAGVRLIGVC